MQKKSESFAIRLSTKENEALKKLSEKTGLKRSVFIRKIIREVINNNIELSTEENLLLKSTHQQLVGISNNFNQLVAAINSKVISGNVDINCILKIMKSVSAFKSELKNHIERTQKRLVKYYE